MQKDNEEAPGVASANMALIMPNVRRMVCGELATSRVEILAPRDGHDEPVLDGVMFHCERHADTLVEVVGWDSTGTLSTRRTAVAVRDIRCGSGWDYVAGIAIEPVAR